VPSLLTDAVARNRRRGAAAVELAIVLPFVVFLFLVVVDFCRVYACTQTVQGCAETAVLFAGGTALPPPDTAPDDAARQAAVADGALLDPPLGPDGVGITRDSSTVTVTVTYNFQTLVPYPGMSQTLTLQRTVTLATAPKVGHGN
jgi:Flp pilus assembly protein TadG